MEESVVFTFPYQTNRNHIKERSTVGHVFLRTALKSFFQFHLNCKQIQVEARNSMPNCEIYVPIFSEIIQTNLKIFSQIVIGSVGTGYCKKHMVLEFLTKTFVLVAPAPLKD